MLLAYEQLYIISTFRYLRDNLPLGITCIGVSGFETDSADSCTRSL